MTTINMTHTTKKTIVYFHTGRGGHFHNSGHRTFNGTYNIGEVLSMNDNGKRNSFLNKENESEIYRLLKKRDLDNLLELFEKCSDNSDFAAFEKKTGLKLGQNIYADCNGNEIISEKEVESGIGLLNWDYEYDTDECIFLSDCDESDLHLIIESNEWNNEYLIQEYFNESTDLEIDWDKFNGNYSTLIDEYFNFPNIDITEFYKA